MRNIGGFTNVGGFANVRENSESVQHQDSTALAEGGYTQEQIIAMLTEGMNELCGEVGICYSNVQDFYNDLVNGHLNEYFE